ncbi:MAG TPA: hypothetical protein VKY92_22220 [Verrucomicrobiae bacterium]|nr:hypothetical protein [Verrucomicrobiae bacterium]
MAAKWYDIRRLSAGALSLAGLVLLLLALVWPSSAERIFRSRLAVVSLGSFFILLNPALREGLMMGITEFMKATAEVAEEIRRAIDGDDDDGPRTT